MAPTSPLAASVFAGGLLLVGLGTWGAADGLPGFWDPCMSWGEGGQSGNGTSSSTVSPGDDCQARSGTSETKAQAAGRMAAVFGGAIVAGASAGTGAWRRRPAPTLVAGLLMVGETIVLFLGISVAFPLALGLAVLFLVAAWRWRRPPAAATVSDGL